MDTEIEKVIDRKIRIHLANASFDIDKYLLRKKEVAALKRELKEEILGVVRSNMVNEETVLLWLKRNPGANIETVADAIAMQKARNTRSAVQHALDTLLFKGRVIKDDKNRLTSAS